MEEGGLRLLGWIVLDEMEGDSMALNNAGRKSEEIFKNGIEIIVDDADALDSPTRMLRMRCQGNFKPPFSMHNSMIGIAFAQFVP